MNLASENSFMIQFKKAFDILDPKFKSLIALVIDNEMLKPS